MSSRPPPGPPSQSVRRPLEFPEIADTDNDGEYSPDEFYNVMYAIMTKNLLHDPGTGPYK